MKYVEYDINDFASDEYFQTWVWGTDAMTDNFWQQWLLSHPEKKGTVQQAKKLVLMMDLNQEELSDSQFDTMWQHIVEHKGRETYPLKRKSKNRTISTVLKVAAVFLALISIGGGLYYSGFFSIALEKQVVSDGAITLELEDGTIKVLEETATKILRQNTSGMKVMQNENTLLYEAGENHKKLVFNTLTVPLGKRFELLLSDGTHVFLNAGTKLRYPVNFLKSQPRDVYLDGEAYFDVRTDSLHPFTVITDDMNTRVYGTSFNVSSYKNDKNTSTVLVEGSVGVYLSNNSKGEAPIVLVPGQQASFVDNKVQIETVDVRKYKAWTKGKLYFVEDRFDIILKELQRHFDVTIENRYEQLSNIRFTGTFEDESLTEILNIFQEHTSFHYEVKGDQIIILKNKSLTKSAL